MVGTLKSDRIANIYVHKMIVRRKKPPIHLLTHMQTAVPFLLRMLLMYPYNTELEPRRKRDLSRDTVPCKVFKCKRTEQPDIRYNVGRAPSCLPLFC